MLTLHTLIHSVMFPALTLFFRNENTVKKSNERLFLFPCFEIYPDWFTQSIVKTREEGLCGSEAVNTHLLRSESLADVVCYVQEHLVSHITITKTCTYQRYGFSLSWDVHLNSQRTTYSATCNSRHWKIETSSRDWLKMQYYYMSIQKKC